jgi:hypothetical protein
MILPSKRNSLGANKMIKIEKFNVRIVNTGEKYGLDDCLINEKEQMVEFYDSRFDHKSGMGRGQFVNRYYTSTILSGEYPNGLCLDFGIPEWTISANGMQQVADYLR